MNWLAFPFPLGHTDIRMAKVCLGVFQTTQFNVKRFRKETQRWTSQKGKQAMGCPSFDRDKLVVYANWDPKQLLREEEQLHWHHDWFFFFPFSWISLFKPTILLFRFPCSQPQNDQSFKVYLNKNFEFTFFFPTAAVWLLFASVCQRLSCRHDTQVSQFV